MLLRHSSLPPSPLCQLLLQPPGAGLWVCVPAGWFEGELCSGNQSTPGIRGWPRAGLALVASSAPLFPSSCQSGMSRSPGRGRTGHQTLHSCSTCAACSWNNSVLFFPSLAVTNQKYYLTTEVSLYPSEQNEPQLCCLPAVKLVSCNALFWPDPKSGFLQCNSLITACFPGCF